MAGTSYTRQSTFADGDTITAALFNDEYNQLVNAFSYASSGTTGHRHDGTAGEGGNIHIIGDEDFLNKISVDGTNNRWGFYVQVGASTVEQIRIQDGAIVPVTDDDIDLGTSSLEFKNLYLDGTATIDTLTVDGAATVGTTLGVTGATTLSSTLGVTGAATFNGNVTIGDAATDTLTITADVSSNIIPSADSTYTLGDSSNYWSHGYIDAVTTTGNISVGGNLIVTGNATISGNLTFGDAPTDTINLAADVASNILPSADNTYDIGATGAEWKDIYINGVAYVDSIDLAGTAITATAAELNTLDGITATVSELNTLDGITATVTELNYTDGVTSAIQTQLDNKQPLSAVLTATTASFTTADETKLDGIEAGATADQTASEILSALLTVDGTGTGLDADLLDGNHATAFATAAQGTLADSALQSSDIGVTVQGYDADTAKYDDVTANFTGTLQNGGSNVVVDSDIGSTVQAYDSNLTSFVGTFTLPTTDSTAGYVLKTDGAGTLSFVAQSAYDESSVAITGGSINGTTIGATTASTGNFSTLSIGGTAITSTAAELNILDGVTATTAELNYLDITTLGTTEASKAVTADANGVVTFDNGISEEYTAVTSSSNATTCNMRDGTNFSHTLTENTTFTFSNPASSGKVSAFTLKIVQDASASGYTVTWPTSVDWPSATAPTLTATASAVDYFVFITHDGGTTWYGFTAGQAMA